MKRTVTGFHVKLPGAQDAAVLALFAASPAQSQNYLSQSINILIPFSAGTAINIASRICPDRRDSQNASWIDAWPQLKYAE